MRFSSTLSRSSESSAPISVDEAALQPRTHALVELVHLARRTGRGHHHLPAAIEQRVDDVIELLLGLGPVQELEIVDQQDVDRAELVLERQRIGAAQRLHELIAEALGRQIEHLRRRRATLHLPGDRVQQDASCRARPAHG